MSQPFKRLPGLFATLFIGALVPGQNAYAAPTVSGNTITVGSDGWYQIQSATDYSTLCEGTTSCTVPAGQYTVINHSTGERFEGIVVEATSPPPTDSVTVEGNTIRWPDDGWYQVQSARDFTTVCQGGTSCEVEPGTYIVINHSNGQRYESIQVTDSGEPTPPPDSGGTGFTVTGNTLSWTNDNWYQVQSAEDFHTLCEGGTSCTLSPGLYNIINHSTGTRVDNFLISAEAGSGSAPSIPGNAHSTVYSNTQAELFWDASSDDGFVMGYDIYRNGSKIVSLLDARSYFEPSLNAGTSYEYRIIAIDEEGNESEAAIVTLVTTGGTDTPPPSTDTVAAALPPMVDSSNQVSWNFSPQNSDLAIVVEPYVEMPLASNGSPARWNDMETLGDRLFVVDEQDGRVYEITNREVSLWFDISSAVRSVTGRVLNIDNPFHGGVRGIAFHPDFNNNGKFYTSLLEQRPTDTSSHYYISDAATLDADSVLVEWTVNTSSFVVDPNSYREVFRVGIPEYDHPIKQIAFDPSVSSGSPDFGLLYIAHGDGSRESTTAVGGQGNNALGKILRINPLQSGSAPYSIPGDNPFVGDSRMIDEAWSIGHRNPHHLAFMNDGTLLVGEDGRDNIDEINLITAGADYGWSQREGAYVHLEGGTLVNGITTLPANDADNGYTYPVAQFGHTGTIGVSFTGQALGGGFVVENGSALDGHYFYIDFPKSGDVFYSSISGIRDAVTRGTASELTVAKTWLSPIRFDHDNNSDTAALDMTLREIIRSSSGYTHTDRVDVRYGQGANGELYLMSKRNNMVYRISNSMPPGTDPVDPGGPVGTGRPPFDTGSHGFEVWSLMSSAAQAVTPSDCLLTAAQDTGPYYCFSPYDRRLMRIEYSGQILWQFPLPGDNASNHIEAISFVNGGTIITTADATPSPDDSAFDISVFYQSGAYQGSYHIIPDIENPDGVDFAGVNLDGLDLIVRTGPIRENPESTSAADRWLNDLYIYAEHYSEIPGADNTQLSGWNNEGAFRARLDTRNGATLDTILFPGLTAAQALAVCPVPASGSGSLDGC